MLEPREVMMVAAHRDDLRLTREQGLRTAFVMRSLKHGPEAVPDLTVDPSFDVVAADLVDLADQIGVWCLLSRWREPCRDQALILT